MAPSTSQIGRVVAGPHSCLARTGRLPNRPQFPTPLPSFAARPNAASPFSLTAELICGISRLELMSLQTTERALSGTLLIVDDDESARNGLRSIFEMAGHRAIAVSDAPAALQLLRRQPCDLVMVDVTLPEVDGLALCRLVRAQPELKQLPVVVFSADDSESRKIEAFDAGADDYIVKPSTPGELLSPLTSHLSNAQA